VPERIGNRYEFIYPYDAFKAKNGWVILGIGNNKIWESFCKAIERPDLLDNPRFLENYDRVKAHKDIKQIVEDWTRNKKVKVIVAFFQAKKIPCAPIYSVKDIVEDEHIAVARGMIRDIDHPIAGNMKVIGSPVNLSETPIEIHSPAPMLGQHTKSVLSDILNMTCTEILSLKEQKIIN